MKPRIMLGWPWYLATIPATVIQSSVHNPNRMYIKHSYECFLHVKPRTCAT